MLALIRHRLVQTLIVLVALAPSGGCERKESRKDASPPDKPASPPRVARPPAPAGAGGPAPAVPTIPAPPAVSATPATPVAAVDPSLYGKGVGEATVPADRAPQDAPLRARRGDTFFRVSNVRVVTNRPGLPALGIDYERVFDGEHNGISVVLEDSRGNARTVSILGPMFDKSGTLEIEQRMPNFGGPAFPEDLEVYFVRGDHRYGVRQRPTFKVSNSATRGTIPNPTLARDWTPEEAARLSKPPPNFNNYNAFPSVGHDTEFAGDTTGGAAFRILDPKLHMLGVEYRVGAWDGEQSIGQLVPVFERDQEVTFEPRIIAREGYAVGGIDVQSKRYVNAVRLTFMKLRPDGTLDPKDAYASDWIGYPAEGTRTLTLGGDGRRVIGIHSRQGAILNSLALVMDKSKAP